MGRHARRVARLLAVLASLTGPAMAAPPDPALHVAVGYQVYPAADLPALLAALAAENAMSRIEGLADEFNPTVIDAAKLQAFLRALSPETVAALAGRPLFLDSMGFRIATSSPSTAASFVAPLALRLGRDEGGTIAATASIPPDCAVAPGRAAAARALAQEADAAVKALQAKRADAGPAMVRRYAVARAWEENAAAAAVCAPKDRAAAADHAAATRAAKAAIVLGGRMG